MNYEKSLTVAAEPARLWEVLSDIERWPERITTYEEVRRLDRGRPEASGARPTSSRRVWRRATGRSTELESRARRSPGSRQPGVRIVGRHAVSSDSDGSQPADARPGESGWLAGVVGMLLGRKVREYVDLEAAR